MDDNLVEVSYLIEGAQEHLSTFISNNSNGDDLRKLIFDEECKQLVSRYRDLTILKMNVVNLDGVYLPLLRLNDGDGGVEEISPTKTISEIWPEPLPANRIQVFVKLTRLFHGVQERQGLLNAAHMVYHGFWGNDNHNVNDLLRPVPNHPDVKYIATEHIAPLKSRLVYIPSALLVRKEYEDLYDTLWSYKNNRGRPLILVGGVVVAGQPGIGKTYFSYYLLLRLLNEKQPVALQVNDRYVLFQHTGVLLRGYMSTEDMPPETWAISDSTSSFESPCLAFLNACKRENAWVIHTTSPLESNWKRWAKDHLALMYWMDVLSPDEMMALGKVDQYFH